MVNDAAVALIKKFESLHDGDLSLIGLQPKRCPAGIWSVGYGHALRDNNGKFLRMYADKGEAYRQFARLEESGACALLEQDLQFFAEGLMPQLQHQATDNQFGAMVSLAYNIGLNAFKGSSVLRFYNAGDINKAADSFLLWNKGTNKYNKKVVLPGLVKRRLAEKALFLTA